MFSSPILEKVIPSPVLGKVSVHYCEIVLASPVHAVLGKGSKVQYCKKVL